MENMKKLLKIKITSWLKKHFPVIYLVVLGYMKRIQKIWKIKIYKDLLKKCV